MLHPQLIECFLQEVLFHLHADFQGGLLKRRYMPQLLDRIIQRFADLLMADIGRSKVLPKEQKLIIINALSEIKTVFLSPVYIQEVLLKRRLLRLGVAAIMRVHLLKKGARYESTKAKFMSAKYTTILKQSIFMVVLNEFIAVLTRPQLLHPQAEEFLLTLLEVDYGRKLYYDPSTWEIKI